MRTYLICAKHQATALVGPGTPLGELECVTCIAEQDEANRWRPCCSAYNTTCCGHDDDEGQVFFVELQSPNFCDDEHRDPEEVPF
jgi:hypothetical protein